MSGIESVAHQSDSDGDSQRSLHRSSISFLEIDLSLRIRHGRGMHRYSCPSAKSSWRGMLRSLCRCLRVWKCGRRI